AEARVRELNRKLNEIGGDDSSNREESEESLYPSIRKLPLLGVTYADLYRRAKIEETVFELLTQQYELAKIQEAKEIPSVKVLDVALEPTEKSFPPTIEIIFVGSVLGLFLGLVCVGGRARWNSIDDLDPRKAFATEVLATVALLIREMLRL